MRKTKAEAEATKEKIIEAALYIFLEKGYSQTSVEDIVTSLDLTRGAFYWHFKDKDDVFKCIIEKEQSQRIESLNSIILDNDDEKTQLKKVMINIMENFYNNERYRSFIKLRWFRIEHDPKRFELPVTKHMNRTTRSKILNIIVSAKKKGLLAAGIAPIEIVSHLIALTNGIYRLYFIEPGFFLKKGNSIKMINDYIELLFKK